LERLGFERNLGDLSDPVASRVDDTLSHDVFQLAEVSIHRAASPLPNDVRRTPTVNGQTDVGKLSGTTTGEVCTWSDQLDVWRRRL
jgi:hypothetical protein